MPEFIRVRWNDSGTEQTIPKPVAIDEDAYTVLKDEPTDRNGRPVPPKLAQAPTYEERTVADLKDEIARRNQGREEADLIPTSGNKPDLIAALAADDGPSE